MIRPSLFRLFLTLTSVTFPLTAAQITQTIANPNIPGGSIVELISTDINGLLVTTTALSIPPVGAATTASTTTPLVNPVATALTTTTPVSTTVSTSKVSTTVSVVTQPAVQGPVAQPAPTVPVGQGVTQYTYTTVDALGQTTVLQDIFTPTYNTPSPPSSPAVGTVLGMSAWSALIGTNTSGSATNEAQRWQLTRAGVGGLFALACGIVAGALTVL